MTDREFVLDVMRKSGLASARNLRERAVAGASGTEVIGEEEFVPNYPPDGKRDFTAVPLGAPYKYDGQVYKLWSQHNANGQPNWSPDKAFSLWDIYHTTDSARAKPYLPVQGARGLYQTGECMIWTDGLVYRSKRDNNDRTPDVMPDWWEVADV